MPDRSVQRVLDAVPTLEGAGFLVHRPFPTGSLDQLDPFLLLDEMGPSDLAPGQAKGAPDHPHRGFETVTYLLDGAMEHRDSQGNKGQLRPGDVQWMTAGSGVVHSEMPEESFLRRGGRMHGFQLWVNLPRRDKMTKPRYQEIPAARIPVARGADRKATVRVIAGESLGEKAVIDTRTPIFYLDAALEPGGLLSQPAPPQFNAFAYMVSGRGQFGPERIEAGSHQMVVFGNDGDTLRVAAASDEPLRVLLIGGVPLGEPVARYGPFVMNTRQELIQAYEDFQSGKLGEIR